MESTVRAFAEKIKDNLEEPLASDELGIMNIDFVEGEDATLAIETEETTFFLEFTE